MEEGEVGWTKKKKKKTAKKNDVCLFAWLLGSFQFVLSQLRIVVQMSPRPLSLFRAGGRRRFSDGPNKAEDVWSNGVDGSPNCDLLRLARPTRAESALSALVSFSGASGHAAHADRISTPGLLQPLPGLLFFYNIASNKYQSCGIALHALIMQCL